MTGQGGAGRLARPGGTLLICGIALVVMLPELIAGPSYTDSFRYNHVWTEQFTALFAGGELYPRWLPGSWFGLGSPTFYFYPPLFFWVAAIVRWLSAGWLTAGAAATVGWGLFLAASGLAMRAWLREHVAPETALGGAIGYMLAPYHLYDIYCRGALAEACSYVFLPLILLAIARLAERRGGVALLWVSYAGLLLSHLPLALLASVTLIPMFVFWRARSTPSPRRFLAVALAGGLLGIALAATYWLPALRLIPYISADALGGDFYRPDIWFFWRPGDWPGGLRMSAIVLVTIAALSLSIAGAFAARTREAWFWCAVTGIGVVLISGALPFLWRISLLAQVQFPWRMLPIVELATITALALGLPRLRSPLVVAGGLALIGGATLMALVAARMIEAGWREGAVGRAIVSRGFEEAPEYLPRGFPIALDDQKRADPSGIRLPRGALAAADDARAGLRAVTGQGGVLAVTVDSPAPTTITVRRFYFPHWRVTEESGSDVVVRPGETDQLASWRAEPGRHVYLLAPGLAPGEAAGRWISLAALLALLLLALKTCLPYSDRARNDD